MPTSLPIPSLQELRAGYFRWHVGGDCVAFDGPLSRCLGFGSGAVRLTPRYLRSLLTPATLAGLLGLLHGEETSVRHRCTMSKNDGSTVHLWLRARIERDAAGRVLCVTGFALDMTDDEEESTRSTEADRARAVADVARGAARMLEEVAQALEAQLVVMRSLADILPGPAQASLDALQATAERAAGGGRRLFELGANPPQPADGAGRAMPRRARRTPLHSAAFAAHGGAQLPSVPPAEALSLRVVEDDAG